jgi:hypothetical protein
LATVERSGAALLKRRIDVKPRGTKIVTGHGRMLFLARRAFASITATTSGARQSKMISG